MDVEHMFATPLGIEELNDVDNDSLIEYCCQKLRPEGQSLKLNANSYPLKHLTDKVTERVNLLHKTCGLKSSQEVTAAWCNHGNHPLICRPHTHGRFDAFFVAIYYLNDSDVRINFQNPMSNIENLISADMVEEYNQFNQFVRYVYPRKGLLLIHPAWIVHYVDDVKDDRMSIAFNFKIKR
jgi:hypothetical protein